MKEATKVEPALTAEEWSERGTYLAKSPGFFAVWVHDRGGGCLSIESDEAPHDPSVAIGITDPADRHALAALCLHDQPFGFTEGDRVTLLRCALILRGGTDVPPVSAEDVEAVVAKIDALLPR